MFVCKEVCTVHVYLSNDSLHTYSMQKQVHRCVHHKMSVFYMMCRGASVYLKLTEQTLTQCWKGTLQSVLAGCLDVESRWPSVNTRKSK